MEWYIIFGLVLGTISAIAVLFTTYKVRVITNFRTLFDGVRDEKDLEAIADLLNIGVDAVKSIFKIFGINFDVGVE